MKILSLLVLSIILSSCATGGRRGSKGPQTVDEVKTYSAPVQEYPYSPQEMKAQEDLVMKKENEALKQELKKEREKNKPKEEIKPIVSTPIPPEQVEEVEKAIQPEEGEQGE